MHPGRLTLSLCLLFHVPAALRAAEGAPTPAGYWEGGIAMPNRELPIRVEFSRGDAPAWQATIQIPLQGIRGMPLDAIKVDGSTVEFAMPGVPGEPRFRGTLAADGKSIAGDFSQGPGNTTFRLERKAKPPPEPYDETPARGVPGKGLAGKWRGSIKPMPYVELRLALELTADAAGAIGGEAISLDQENARFAVTGATEQDGNVRFETPQVQGSFVGKMNADGSEVAGEWTQRGRPTPLVLKRVPSGK